MQAYEFYAITENGFIRIPDEYKKKLGEKVKVIVVNDENSDLDWDELFPPMINTKGFKFNREEANER